jgi:hypothetical protein
MLVEEIERLGGFGCGLADDAPAPAQTLDFVHRQAIHEAGHAVAARQLGILFSEIRIIYDGGLDFVTNPCEPPDPGSASPVFSDRDRANYCIVYAAGSAAEEVAFGTREDWRLKCDRYCHGRSGGTDFDRDMARARGTAGFSRSVLLAVASAVEREYGAGRYSLSWDDVDQVLKGCGCPDGPRPPWQ